MCVLCVVSGFVLAVAPAFAETPLPPGKPAQVQNAALRAATQYTVVTLGVSGAVLGLGMLMAGGFGGSSDDAGALALQASVKTGGN